MINKKMLIGLGLVTLVPLAIFASSDRYDFDDKRNSSYLKKQGVNFIFEGRLEEKPQNALNGKWIISGKTVMVDEDTIIKQEKKEFRVGDEIEISAKRTNGNIKAITLKQDD